ncbi:PrsW family intramembrane metalloprotease [Acidipropionibacterium timonense]|uniref:PrsW family intramembrane metalloprotease n=1 Tax=Acidipropionibacterium timonense TaxID=2161818 RepID=UPI0024781D51|nr:PrsW family intramembrane metalloprotease [Acidipropionibacterium timonense]
MPRPSTLPVAPATPVRHPWWRAVLRSPWTWVVLAMVLVTVASLWDTYSLMHRDVEVEQDGRKGIVPGITMTSFKLALRYAWPTAAVWSAVFILLDRFRTRHMAVWFTCFAWGGAVASWLSLKVNTWMAAMLSVAGGVDPTSGAGPAVYSAPFVEETTKATVLFLLALFLGRRLTSMVQTVSLAGLTAIGFAFVENIIYYARADNYARVTIQAGDPTAAVHQMFLLRGVYTSFGHPLFTSMTAIGLAIGLRARSRTVRILAPVTGFLGAATGHMIFNGLSSTVPMAQLRIMWWGAVGIVVSLAIFLVTRLFAEGRMIRDRLQDYVVMGWLPDRLPLVVSKLRVRWWIGLLAASWGPRRWWATMTFLRRTTELAYLRDAVVRGLDDATEAREKELLDEIHGLFAVAVVDPVGARFQRPHLPAWWPRRQVVPAAPVAAVPAGPVATSWAPPRP